MKSNKSLLFLLIFFGFLISTVYTLYNYSKHDISKIDPETNAYYHQMIKYDAYRYWEHGNIIKEQLEIGVNFFQTGKENYTKYLPPRLNAIYLLAINESIFEDTENKIIKKNIFFKYLLFQNIFYYLSIIFLFLSIKDLLSLKITIPIIGFLSLEPTIMQYHSSFWSESVFFSIQLLCLALILKKGKKNYHYLFLGVTLGLLSLQKQYAIFLIIPILIFYIINFKKRLNFSFIIIGFFLVLSIIGFNNYKRSGKFYILTADTTISIHIDLVSKVMSKKLNITNQEFRIIEGKYAKKWIIENKKFTSVLKNKNPDFMDYRSTLLEKDKVLFDNYFRNRSLEYIVKYPFDFGKFILKSSAHTFLLNPFHIYSDNNFRSGELYYGSKTHQKLLIPRVLYSAIIYIIIIGGIIQLFKENREIFIIISILFLYFYGLVAWHGNTRYFVPCLIYLAFYFGYGLKFYRSLVKKF